MILLPHDAVIIAESGKDGLTGILPERLAVDGMPASIQVIANYISNRGRVIKPVDGDGMATWWSAPKLNGVYLFGYLQSRGFNNLLINKYYPERDKAEEAIKKGPVCVVISTTFVRSRHALAQMINDIRSVSPGAFIIAGGPFVYLSFLVKQRSSEPDYLTDEAKDEYLFFAEDDPQVDIYVVSPLGDDVLCDIMGRLKKGLPLDGIRNTARRIDGEYYFGERDDDVSRAAEAGVDWDRLPGEIFASGVMPVQASKGCPYRCAFCNFVKDRRLIYVKPLDRLIRELKILASNGIRYIWFVDDNFRLGSSDLDKTCMRIIEEGLGIRWMTMIRAGTLRHMDLRLMKEAGCIEVQLGLESADALVLSNMNKQADPTLYRDVVERVLEVGINCSCYFIFGFPGETEDSALRTRDFIKSLEHPELEGCLTWSLFPFCLYPMSPVYEIEMRSKYGLAGHLRNWRHRTMDSERAMNHVREAFMELSNSSPVYRGDNLDMLYSLTPSDRKRFMVGRHKISKLAMDRTLSNAELFQAFSGVLPKELPWGPSRSFSPPRQG